MPDRASNIDIYPNIFQFAITGDKLEDIPQFIPMQSGRAGDKGGGFGWN